MQVGMVGVYGWDVSARLGCEISSEVPSPAELGGLGNTRDLQIGLVDHNDGPQKTHSLPHFKLPRHRRETSSVELV